MCVCVNASHIAKLMTACDDDDDGGCGCRVLLTSSMCIICLSLCGASNI